MKLSLGSDYWDSVAKETKNYHLEQNIAIYYRNEHIRLIKEWGGDLEGKSILKTDLYESAFGETSFLFWLLEQKADIFAADISQLIVKKAKSRFEQSNANLKNFVVSDIRTSAFKHPVAYLNSKIFIHTGQSV